VSARERTNQSDVARTQPRKLLGLDFSFGRVAASHLPGSARLACWSRRLAETNFSVGLPYRHSRPNILFRLMTDEEAIATVRAELSRRFISGHGLDHGGIDLLVVPDMRRTFDRDRPETSVAHVLADFSDGGIGTCRDGYEEHLRYVHPILIGQRYSEAEIQRQAPKRPGFGQGTALISTLGLKRDSRRCCIPRLTSFPSGLSTQVPS
jgi:hypothetical protein